MERNNNSIIKYIAITAFFCFAMGYLAGSKPNPLELAKQEQMNEQHFKNGNKNDEK